MRGKRAEQAVKHALTEVLAPWDGELRLTNSRYTGSTSPYLTVVHIPQPAASTPGEWDIALCGTAGASEGFYPCCL